MSNCDSHDDPPDTGSELSRDAVTPRGGFMARPGLKPPPRHAVVVRVGNAPLSEHIPVARSSFPPPAPSSVPAPVSLSEKITLRAIPTPKPPSAEPVTPRIASIVFDGTPPPAPRASTTMLPPVLESAPPPSDAPTVSNIEPSESSSSPRRRSSRWAIFAAGAAGLILGLASVAATTGLPRSSVTPTAAAPSLPEQSVVAPQARLEAAPAPSASVEPPQAPVPETAPLPAAPAPRPTAPAARKSIF